MSLLAALVSSLPQGQGQGQGEDCGDEIECLKQNIPGKRVNIMEENVLIRAVYRKSPFT